MMISELYLFLPAILLLGLITSYDDIKKGKIKNAYILASIIYGIIAYIAILSYYSFLGADVNYRYILEMIIGVILSCFVAFVIWQNNMWTAGDGKLFIAFAFLLPLSAYKYGYVPFFPQIALLINTFVPILVFFFFSIMFKTSILEKKTVIDELLKNKFFAGTIPLLFAGNWLLNVLFTFIKIPSNIVFSMTLLFFFAVLLENIFGKKAILVFLALSILRILLDKSIFSLNFIVSFSIMYLTFVIFRFLIVQLSFVNLVRFVDINLLEEKMIPAEIVYKDGKKYRRESLSYYGIFQPDKKNVIIKPSLQGLTKKEITVLNKLYRAKKLDFEHLCVHTTWPFALFLFIGVLITILIKGDIFTALMSQIAKFI